MVVELQGIKDALVADDGEGSMAGIAAILFDLLPILLAGNVSSGELAGSVEGILDFLSSTNPSLQSANVQELVNALQLGSGGGCCEPNPTQNGMVFLPPSCIDYAGYDIFFAQSGMTVVQRG